jgi:hypothetical protein
MTAINLAVSAILRMSNSSASNLPESPAALSLASGDTAGGEGEFPESLLRDAHAKFSEPLWYTRSDKSQSILTSSINLDDAWTSHRGEIARARAIQRIGELRECAQEEEIEINDASQWDLLKFISRHTSQDDLNIFLLDGGTFRVIWKTSPDRQVGFEFLGKGALKKTRVNRDPNTGQYSVSSEFVTLEVDEQF